MRGAVIPRRRRGPRFRAGNGGSRRGRSRRMGEVLSRRISGMRCSGRRSRGRSSARPMVSRCPWSACRGWIASRGSGGEATGGCA
jgi:hypothetical protein